MPEFRELSKLRSIVMRENPSLDRFDLSIEQGYHLLSKIGAKRLAETIVHLFCQVRHPKWAERQSLFYVCRAHKC
jgi:hypothetical protein